MNYELINPINENYQPIEQVLINRGFQYKDISDYLKISARTKVVNHNPLFLKNIRSASEILINALSDENSRICVQVDADCDGFTSSALLLNYIHAVFPSAISKFYYNFHKTKAHGIDVEYIQPGTTLVIAPDSSSNEYEIHQTLAEQGIKVLVLDHHQAPHESEYACVVNNQLCDYPNKFLSGVGIVYKLCQYIDSLLPESERRADYFLDLVAVGLVGDMMNLQDLEVHTLVVQGLADFRNPFIKGMAEKNHYQLGDNPAPIDIAFYIVPLINAITRVGSMDEKTLLFESMLEWKAYDLIPSTKRGCAGQLETRLEQSLRTCTNVKNRQTRDQDKAVEQVREIIEDEDLLTHKVLAVKVEQPDYDRSITGLIANRLMGEFQHPVCLLSPSTYEGQSVWAGSARCPTTPDLADFRKFCENSQLVCYAQGHPSAFGLALTDENVDKFVEYADFALQSIDFSPKYKVDFIFKQRDNFANVILDLGCYETLWGQEINLPLIAVENIAITKDMLTLMSKDKNPTLKIQLSNGVACIKFKSSEEELDSLYSESGCVNINLIARAEVNRYFNSVTPQLIIQDYEIINRQEYYF